MSGKAEKTEKPRVAIYKFTSCSGCQQAILNIGENLPKIFGSIDITYFIEGQSDNLAGPYDLAIVEGSISTPEEIERIKELRRQSKTLIAIGACAVNGGPQALRNWVDVQQLKEASYSKPEYIDALNWSTGIDAYISVDYQVYGCGPNPEQLVEVLTSFLQGRPPTLPQHSVCVECKSAGNTCLLVAAGRHCLGPMTAAGCGAVCPSHRRGCYGCFGPMNAPNAMALARVFEALGVDAEEMVRIFRNQNSNAPAFKEVALAYAQKRRLAA